MRPTDNLRTVPASAPGAARRLIAWAVFLPLAAHLAFSWIGFTPLDDGWLQAVARRLLAGEVPHRDFIFIRPALSAFLQIPVVALGGDYVLWLARLWGWLTVAGIAWIWSGLAVPAARPLERGALYAMAFCLTAHNFPVMAWHSLDGLLFASLAVWLVRRGTLAALRGAFACVGLAALCRQNFAFFGPVLLLACSDPRKWRAMAWAALAPLLYVAGLGLAGAWPDFLEQIAAPGDAFVRVAVHAYLARPFFYWAVPLGAGLGFAWPLLATRAPALRGVVVAGVLAFLTAGLAYAQSHFHPDAFVLFGFALGFVPVSWGRAGFPAGERLPVLSGLGLAWVASISIGYNSPAFATGILLLLVWRAAWFAIPDFQSAPSPVASDRVRLALAAVGALALGGALWHVRHAFPYFDRPAAELEHNVGAVLRGGAGLRTNATTFEVLAELQALTARYETEQVPYAILTDGSAAWIGSVQRNPLPCDWPSDTELGFNEKLVNRCLDAVRRLPPATRIIVQRYRSDGLALGRLEIPSDLNFYFIQNRVRAEGRVVGATKNFEIFAPPAAPR